MWIKGYVQDGCDNAFMADVHIVRDIRYYAGENVGYMELSNSDEIVLVKKHPAGTYNGQIVKESSL